MARSPHQPVDVWQPIVSGGARSLDFMACHGLKGVISATAESVVERWLRDYQEAGKRHGRRLRARRGRDSRLPDGSTRRRIESSSERVHTSRSTPGSWRRSGMLRDSEERTVGGGRPAGAIGHRDHAGTRRPRPKLAVRPGRRRRRLSQVAGAEVPRAGARHDRVGWARRAT